MALFRVPIRYPVNSRGGFSTCAQKAATGAAPRAFFGLRLVG